MLQLASRLGRLCSGGGYVALRTRERLRLKGVALGSGIYDVQDRGCIVLSNFWNSLCYKRWTNSDDAKLRYDPKASLDSSTHFLNKKRRKGRTLNARKWTQ